MDRVSITIPGRAVPWSAAFVTKRGGAFKNQSLMNWQAKVKEFAKATMELADLRPIDVPVELRFDFYLNPRGPDPDLTNIVKSTEDGLRKVAITDDRLVKAQTNRYHYTDGEQFARVEIRLLDPNDYIRSKKRAAKTRDAVQREEVKATKRPRKPRKQAGPERQQGLF